MMKMDLDKHEATKARFGAKREELGLAGAVKSEGGAIDLASIMVGVIVIGVIAGVIAATVFAVIPWAQDQAASQALDAVKTAESVQYAQSTGDKGVGEYKTLAQLVTGEQVQDSDSIAIVLTTDAASKPGYLAFSLSSSGKVYVSDHKGGTPAPFDTLAAATSDADNAALLDGATVTKVADKLVVTAA